MIRIGFGFDVHQLVADRPLWLGGICIPHTHGLLGHSDADVLIHAMCDALLGAAGMRDIGFHFPDTGADNIALAEKYLRLAADGGNRDAIVALQTIFKK